MCVRTKLSSRTNWGHWPPVSWPTSSRTTITIWGSIRYSFMKTCISVYKKHGNMLREAVKNSTNLGLWFNLRGEGLVVPNPLNIPDSFLWFALNTVICYETSWSVIKSAKSPVKGAQFRREGEGVSRCKAKNPKCIVRLWHFFLSLHPYSLLNSIHCGCILHNVTHVHFSPL